MGGEGIRLKPMGPQVLPHELDDSDGSVLVRLARASVEERLAGGGRLDVRRFLESLGVRGARLRKLMRPGAAFVTIESLTGRIREMRGCIGAITPIDPLAETVARVSVESATSDPRFPPMEKAELDSVVFEVTVLGRLEALPGNPKKRVEMIEIGRHGLMVEKPPNAGLLLPQVAIDEGWDPHLFLTWTCIKAGLPGTCWLDSNVKVYRFDAAAWAEKEPKGRIYRRL